MSSFFSFNRFLRDCYRRQRTVMVLYAGTNLYL